MVAELARVLARTGSEATSATLVFFEEGNHVAKIVA